MFYRKMVLYQALNHFTLNGINSKNGFHRFDIFHSKHTIRSMEEKIRNKSDMRKDKKHKRHKITKRRSST